MTRISRAIGGSRRRAVRTSNGHVAEEVPPAVPIWLILCSVALGAAFRVPIAGPERAVEGALVLAGVVAYPPSSLMAHYYLGSWTLLHQVGALLLLAGIDQRIVEYFFCIFASGLLLGALAMLIYGFSRRPLFSLAAGTICFLTGMVAHRFASPDYPLIGATWDSVEPHSFGVWAGAITAWVFGSLAGGRNVLAGVSAALLVAVHPVIGVYVVGILIAVLVAGRLFLTGLPIAGIGRGLLLGGLATAVSFGFYLAMRPPVTVSADAGVLETYMRVWEFHRTVAMPSAAVVLKPVVYLSVALLAVLILGSGRRSSTDVGALALLGTAVASSLLYFAAHLVPDLLPEIVKRGMPGRLLNLHAYVAGAVAVGVAAWMTNRSLPWLRSGTRPGPILRVLWKPATVYAVFVVLLAIGARVDRPLQAFAVSARDLVRNGLPYFGDADPFWSAVRASAVRGLVLTSYDSRYHALVEGHLSVAFDLTGFDFVPYLPHTVKDVQRMVERGYGVSFSNPPKQLEFRGGLEGDPEREYWAGLTAEQWRALGGELDIVGVLAPSEWAIMLPPQVPGPPYTLYLIPPAP